MITSSGSARSVKSTLCACPVPAGKHGRDDRAPSAAVGRCRRRMLVGARADLPTLCAVQLLLGSSKIESTVRYLAITREQGPGLFARRGEKAAEMFGMALQGLSG